MAYIGNDPSNRFVAPKAASVFSGDGSTTAFTLDHAVGSDEDILVSVDGVIQEPSVAYAVSSGTTLTFTAAPSSNSGNNIFVYYLFRTVGTVSHPSNNALVATSGTFSAGVTATTGTFSGVLKTDDTTEATSTTDGSLQTDGGLSVAKDIVAGDDIHLKSDSSKITFGSDSEIEIEHAHNEGIKLQGSGTNTQLSLLSFHSTNGTIPDLRIGKSGSDTIGTFAETADGESIAQIRFTGVDSNGSNRSAAQITVIQDGSATSSTVPANMRFSTTGSERMRIVDEGLLINCTSTLHSGVERSLEVENHSGSGFVAIFKGNNKDHETVAIHNSDTSGTRILLAFKTSGSTGTLVGRVTSDGSTTTYATSSDYRLKENVSYDFDATTRLKQLKPARFNWIADESNTTVDGFIAHEVSSVVPEAVIGEKDAVDADGNIDPQGIDQSKLVPLLVKSLQEAIAEIDTLKTKVAALESK